MSPRAGADFLDGIRTELEARIRGHAGVVGVAIADPESGGHFAVRADEPFPSASVIKFPLMVEVFSRIEEGQLSLDDPLTLLNIDRTSGSGVLRYLSAPKELTVWDAVFLMIALSDNVATNLVLEKISPRSVSRRMRELGYQHTRMFLRVNEEAEESPEPDSAAVYGLGVTTPNEMVDLYTRLYRKELVSAEASTTMLAILSEPILQVGLPRRLPTGVKVAHKTGSIDAARNDCGIIYGPERHYVMCVMTKDNRDTSWGDHNEAELLMADLALLVYRHLNPNAVGGR